MNRRRTPAVAAAAVIVVLLGGTGAAYTAHLGPWASSAPPDYGPVIARVDGRPIYFDLAQARVAGLSSVHGSLDKTMGADWPQKILDSLVDDQLIEAEAARRGISVSSDELSQHVARLQQQFPSGSAFESWLNEQGMDLAELERRITLQTLGARVYEEVTAGVTVDMKQIRDYYDSHKPKYTQDDGTRTPLFDVRDSIRQQLLSNAQDQAFAAWLAQRRSTATVVVVDPNWWRNLS